MGSPLPPLAVRMIYRFMPVDEAATRKLPPNCYKAFLRRMRRNTGEDKTFLKNKVLAASIGNM
jgi:hypothetical protein